MAPPLDLSSTYAFEDAAEFARASERKVGAGYVYSRWANPTVDALEAAVCRLEGTEEAEAFSTGMAAIAAVFFALCRSGDRVVATRQLYGNTYSLLKERLPRYGITADVIDVFDIDGIASALPGATLLYCETIGNPRLRVADLARLGELARMQGIPLVVDNTFASPMVCRPAEHGATIVLHSATKFLGGHHDLMGGIACTDVSTVERLRAVARDLGPTLAPFNAWLTLRGLATLHLRVDRACDTAKHVAEFLEGRADVDAVHYPGLDSSPDRHLAYSLLGGRGGATIALEPAGGRDRAAAFQEALELVKPAASLGGSHSLLVHAASVTHTQLDEASLEQAGIGPAVKLVRLVEKLEDLDDVLFDLEQALDKTAA